jgi:hypothetical protein
MLVAMRLTAFHVLTGLACLCVLTLVAAGAVVLVMYLRRQQR